MGSLSLSEFFEGMKMSSVTAHLDSNTSTDETGEGTLNRATFGTRLWEGSAVIAANVQDDPDAVLAKIQYLQEADMTFRVAPGWKLGVTVTSGTVDAISVDRRQVTLSEARAVGELFGITFNTTKRSMHRVIAVSGFEHTVVPALPFGVVVSDVVTFGKPEIDAVIVSADLGSYGAGSRGGIRFNWKQTY
jgi:hypothetical protein